MRFSINRKRLLYKSIIWLLAAILVLPGAVFASSPEVPSSSASLPDIEGHWAQDTIQKWQAESFVTGYSDGSFRPDAAISRAEFVILLDRIFNYEPASSGAAFKDVSSQAYYFDAVQKAVQAGVIAGYANGSFMPMKPVNREEAAVMLYRAFKLKATSDLGELAYGTELQAWSEEAVRTLHDSGYIHGYADGSFGGSRSLTRAEALTLIDRMAGTVIHDEGEYSAVKTRNAIINKNDVVLKDTTIEGNLYLTEGIGEGDVHLERITVKGEVHIYGGGDHSVVLDGALISKLIVDKKNGKVRIVAQDGATVQEVDLLSGAVLEEKAIESAEGFINVKLNSQMPNHARVELTGSFNQIRNETNHSPSIVLNKGRITLMELLYSAALKLNDNTVIELLDVGKDAVIHVSGKGKISQSKLGNDKSGIIFDDQPGSADSGTNPGPEPSPNPNDGIPTFTNAAVHDPSVIKVGDMFYVFGSHLQAAKSSDLMKWQSVASGVTDSNPLIPNVKTELKATFDWAQADTLWAADVIQLSDGKFYFYYNACKGDSPRSALGVAVSDNIEGPYKDLGIILKSGMWGQPGEGGTIYDANFDPNVVDPDVFYDKEGKLWMVYGSYSGGIFILEMDSATAKPKPGQGYGKKLTGGYHANIEGPFMLYSPESDYYYLFTSFGGLDANGGYNIRIARSRTPDGPYYDAEGNDMIDAKIKPNTSGNESIAPYGVKLMGNFMFERKLGEPGSGSGFGYVSPGHNSAYYDDETNRYMLIFHSRFVGRGEEHEIRVHEMFMNDDGWLVAAPYRYAGDMVNTKNINNPVGDYKLINHGKDITKQIKVSQTIALNGNGTITGAVSGTWTRSGDRNVELMIDDIVYKGLFIRQWDNATNSEALTFSAVSDKGVAIWGSQMADLTDQEIVNNAAQVLNLGDTSSVFYDISLPVEGFRNINIAWSSSDPAYITEAGAVNRPASGTGNQTVVLTATITKGTASTTKAFTVVVEQQPASAPLTSHYTFDAWMGSTVKDDSGNGYNGSMHRGVSENTNGKEGSALAFDGNNGYVQLPSVATAAEEFTFATWINFKGGAAWQQIFNFSNGEEKFMLLTPDTGNGSVMFIIRGLDKDYYMVSPTPLPKNEWAHLALTIADNTAKLYVNGELMVLQKNIMLSPVDLQVNKAYIGKSVFDRDPYFNGSLDELKLYNRALTQQELRDMIGGAEQNKVRTKYTYDQDVVTDASDRGFDAQLFGNVTVTSSAYGKIGSAAQFDGSSGYLKLPAGVIATEDITISAWVYWRGGGAFQRIFDMGGPGGFIWLTPSDNWENPSLGLVHFSMYDGADHPLVSTNPLPQNEWVHIAVTISGKTGSLYVNGELQDTDDSYVTAPISLAANDNYIGKSRFPDPLLNGRIDDFTIYDYAMTAEEIMALQTP